MLGIWICFDSFLCVFCFNALFTLCFFVVVVRSINKSGTKSEDSFVQTSQQDPLSCCQCSFTGNFLLHPIFLFLRVKCSSGFVVSRLIFSFWGLVPNYW